MSRSIAYKHYIRALSRWPKDNLRPECQFQEIMKARIDAQYLGAPTDRQSVGPALAVVDEKVEMEKANALYSLLEDRYTRNYPLTGSLLKPASHPTYYTDLMREIEEAPQRSFWEATINKWKGFLRFQ
ncbi:hypothetical protein B7494_g7563 [Chlorociboria aeruginascens]|nr:hypothetical protein B7494_g7563 [Chlorociboria aeruginascens]